MVTISAVFMFLCPSCTLLFYNRRMENRPATDALLEAADAFARKRLSEKRYGHTLRVAETAERLAKAHGLDPARARLAAFLHDAARETKTEEFLRLAKEWVLAVGEAERASRK